MEKREPSTPPTSNVSFGAIYEKLSDVLKKITDNVVTETCPPTFGYPIFGLFHKLNIHE